MPSPAMSTWTFTTQPISVTDTTVADFTAGTLGAGTYVAQSADGEVILTPAIATEFAGTALPAGWSMTPWTAGGAASVVNGAVLVDGARVSLDATGPSGVSLAFRATFPPDPFAHIGFGVTFNEAPWAMFSTASGGGLYARTHDGATSVDTLIPGNWLGTPHTYRIDWTGASVVFFIDGTPGGDPGGDHRRPAAADHLRLQRRRQRPERRLAADDPVRDSREPLPRAS